MPVPLRSSKSQGGRASPAGRTGRAEAPASDSLRPPAAPPPAVDVKKPLRHGPSETSPHSPATLAQGQIFFAVSARSPAAAAVNLPQPAQSAQPSQTWSRPGWAYRPFTGDTAGRRAYPGEGRAVG